jgi:hypothetical protein
MDFIAHFRKYTHVNMQLHLRQTPSLDSFDGRKSE